jgi:hypothetical protein
MIRLPRLTHSKWPLLVAFLMVSGCASNSQLYNWGSYESQVYARFTSASDPAQQIAELEKTLASAKTDRPVPPGFHAHLGLLYGEAGRSDDMIQHFTIEKTLYPEAAPFMDFLLARATAPKGAKTP